MIRAVWDSASHHYRNVPKPLRVVLAMIAGVAASGQFMIH